MSSNREQPADPLTEEEEVVCILAAHFNCGREAAAAAARAIVFRLACVGQATPKAEPTEKELLRYRGALGMPPKAEPPVVGRGTGPELVQALNQWIGGDFGLMAAMEARPPAA